MFYLGSDTVSRRVIEDAHRARAEAFATLWSALFPKRRVRSGRRVQTL